MTCMFVICHTKLCVCKYGINCYLFIYNIYDLYGNILIYILILDVIEQWCQECFDSPSKSYSWTGQANSEAGSTKVIALFDVLE